MKLPPERPLWIVRPMRKTDLDEVHQIETTANIEPWSKKIIGDCIEVGYNCMVVTEDDRVLAYTIVRIAAGEAHILNITVATIKQGRGVGQYLLKEIITLAKHMQSDKIILEVRSTNTPAIRLYEKWGFIKTGERKDYYKLPDESREDAILYTKELK